MSLLKDMPIKRQLALVIMVTCALALLVVCAVLSTYEVMASKRVMARNMTALADILATNSQAALSFDDADAARGVLRALRAEPHVIAARVYDREGKPFADYVREGERQQFPEASPGSTERFSGGRFIIDHAIERDGKLLGSIYVASDLVEIDERVAWFIGVSGLVALGSMVLASVLSSRLQHLLTLPVLSLAKVAKAVAERRDFTLRAPVSGANELGALADSFNHMLSQIHDQNKALFEGELRMRSVLDSALSAVVVTDEQGSIIDWSARAVAIFGRPRSEALGRQVSEVLPARPSQAPSLGGFPLGEAEIQAGREVEIVACRADGARFPAELAVSHLVGDGKTSYCGFITDITERKRASEELARQAERLRHQAAQLAKAHQIARLGNLDIHADGAEGKPESVSWTDDLCRLFGREPLAVERSRDGFLALVDANDRARVAEALTTALATGDVPDFEFGAQLPDTSRHVFSAMIEVERDPSGARGSRLFANIQDITERKLAEVKLQAQLKRLELLQRITRAIGERQDLRSIFQVVIRSLEDNLSIDFSCMCLYDQISKTLVVNNVGFNSREVAMDLALPVRTVIPIDQNGLARCLSGQLVYEPDVAIAEAAFTQRLAKGGLHALVAAPLLVEGRIYGVLMVARREADSFSSGECEFLRQLGEHVALAAHQSQLYTALQQAYDDLRQTQQAAMQQERLRALGQMASGIAHDINNAISPVALYTQSLLEREPNLSERARSYLETIERAIDDVATTVARMREFYRQREPQLSLAPVQLNQLVKQVVDLTRARWSDMPQQQGHVITLMNDLAEDLPSIMGSEGEIREALINLIFNAVDAMPAGGMLTLRTRFDQIASGDNAGNRYARIEVGDTGVGMDEDTRRRCLEPFFTTKGERGTGLGLAMVYGMVQRHSAEIDIISALGKGTTVRLSFLIPDSALHPVVAERVGPLGDKLRLLIVDDDPLLLKSLSDTLTSDGHNVITANGGQVGIDAFRAAYGAKMPFSMVITDLGMPYVDGRKVAAAIKEIDRATPVIMLTGWGQRLIADGDIPPHVDRMLSKPPKLHELRRALRDCREASAKGEKP